MNLNAALIPARSEQQAMDWSLVLLSQDIETTIERDPETQAWALRVDALDRTRAVRAIRQYISENRRPRWVKELPGTGMLFDGRCLAWFLFLVFLFAFEAMGQRDLSVAGRMDNQLVREGAWWRLFTAVTLHGDAAHLMANTITGLVLVGLAMGAFGPGLGLFLPYLAGTAGNLVGYLIYDDTRRALGASGMVMGALGLLAAQWFALLRHGLSPRDLAVRGVLSGCLLLLLLGLSPEKNVDVLAHVTGFVVGLVLGAIFALGPPALHRNAWVSRIAAALFVVLVLIPWGLALRRP